MADDNTVFIGRKETMAYVLAAVTLFNKDYKKVVIKARGRSISKAVDVAEITRHRFIEKAEITDIVTDTEKIDEKDSDRTVNVSSIEITMELKD